MRLLVTGGAGFIGSNFIRYWIKTHPKDHITNLDALTYAGCKKTIEDFDSKHHTFIHGSICDQSTVHKAMEDIETIVHFAAESHVDRSIQQSQIFLQTNVLGTHTLLEEARKRGNQIQRFHHISTDEVFGSLGLREERKFDEDSRYNPHNPYSASKAASDHLCRAYFYTHGVPITISNCSNNYGPYQMPEKFIPTMIISALRDKPLPVYGDGKNVRDWIHVEDHCRGIEAVLAKGKVGETYCLGANQEHANILVAKMILDILKKPLSLLTFVEDRKGHDRRYAIDSAKARKRLNWKPVYGFEDGLRQTIEWYKANESWWKPLLSSK
ncbi:MAG TPA: dTDP-glucose 4,6-dehydratase [Patescibacteria group bacterium]|nr:dTDP-glucose 4,6-dehydratase [Patescibacteria group bacterium]